MKGGPELSEPDITSWNSIYQELAKTIGVEATLKLYQDYRGLQLNLPVRLVSRESMLEQLKIEYTGENKRELARKYDYSQRTIERMLNEIQKE